MNTLLGAISETATFRPAESAAGGGVVTDIMFEGGGGETMPVNLGPAPVIPGGPSFGGGGVSLPPMDPSIYLKPEVETAEKSKETPEGALDFDPETGLKPPLLGKKTQKMNMLLIGGGLLLAYFLLFRKK